MLAQENSEEFTNPYKNFVFQHPYMISAKDLDCFKSRENTDSWVQKLSLEEKPVDFYLKFCVSMYIYQASLVVDDPWFVSRLDPGVSGWKTVGWWKVPWFMVEEA